MKVQATFDTCKTEAEQSELFSISVLPYTTIRTVHLLVHVCYMYMYNAGRGNYVDSHCHSSTEVFPTFGMPCSLCIFPMSSWRGGNQ